MPSPLRAYVDALGQFPFSVLQKPQHYFRRPGRDFTRRRSLYLERIVWLNITLLKTTISVELDRLIRILLPSGETEVLLTTLLDKQKYHWPHFGEIYRKRWGIESCFFVIKSFLQLSNFSAYTVNNCWQDIYSHFILYNLQTAMHEPLDKTIRQINTRRQYNYKPNRNVSAGLLKRFVVKIFLRPAAEITAYLNEFHRQILQTLEAERPGKNKERRRRLMRGTERHVHEKNYRRAF